MKEVDQIFNRNVIFIGIGSNINPINNIKEAIKELAKEFNDIRLSNVIRTQAINRPDQQNYLNLVIMAKTNISPKTIKFKILRPIENKLGRIRSADTFASRTIDLDILLCGEEIINDDDLVIPDPDILDRWFLVKLIAELAPELTHPIVGKKMIELDNELNINKIDIINLNSHEI